ncbi:MAG: hypothetical protein ACREAC_33075 [Blastocatellia bacterium]
MQSRLQTIIREHRDGELLVGAAEIIETGYPSIPWLIAAPTMRMPMTIKNTVHPYLAARAVFLCIQRGVVKDGS